MRCSGCLLQDLWGPPGSICLACQFAIVIYRNQFHTRYIKFIEQWLPTLATESEGGTADPPTQHLQRLCHKSLQNSFSEIRSWSSPVENMYVIENITMLQRDLQNSASSKWSIQSLRMDSISTLECTNDENYSNRESKTIKKLLFGDTATCSSVSLPPDNSTICLPLAPLHKNSIASGERTSISRRQQKNRNRTIAAKQII